MKATKPKIVPPKGYRLMRWNAKPRRGIGDIIYGRMANGTEGWCLTVNDGELTAKQLVDKLRKGDPNVAYARRIKPVKKARGK